MAIIFRSEGSKVKVVVLGLWIIIIIIIIIIIYVFHGYQKGANPLNWLP